ncbi:branched-chain amino acid ABC transporter permease [Methylobacterium sp. IF7SW-B2]|jgi:branched-chain amino acid transport system permease protein|nr:branched-chain amino acid ABC transporter permease [Methylobacterium ajmalii]MBK3411741.1 branched-chain amino acid ABC transporter permease [Methylobacterium ajmalii]MBK3422409.1 branched-chain amino acid ABC transporter permease [Methylobacterium ajmalii]SFF53655.1 amino acid/amide ABC transporter membrane protein 2, HAAT family [Methylobacterium sp. yr596]
MSTLVARMAAAPPRRRAVFPGAALAGLVLAALAALPVAAEAAGLPFLVVTATRMMIFGLAALSLDLVLGYGAMVSFGHAAFIGLGAYAVGILDAHGIRDLAVQAPVAAGACALFALVTGAISLRTRGVYFIMITLAFGQMAYFFMVSLAAYGGDDGLPLSGRSTLFGMRLIEGDPALFYCVLAVLTAALLVLRRVVASRFGRVLRGSRDNAVRMQAIGFSPLPYRLTAYVIAGAIAGLAGVLLANQAEFVSPAYMSWQRSGELIVMVVLGGMGTLVGPVVGAAALIALEEVLAHYSDHWRLGLGLMLVAVVLLSRGGLAGLAAKIGRRA